MSLLTLWAKTGAPDPSNGRIEFHPLIYHLLDVAACAEALLRQQRSRLNRLAGQCAADANDLSRCFIALIALHDIGKCARGFQAKVLDLWPEVLGPGPDVCPPVRHDAAGVWLFEKRLDGVIEQMFPEFSPATRQIIAQAVCSHHGEPTDPCIRNSEKFIGARAERVAVEIAHAMLSVLQPRSCPIEDEYGPLISFWLSGLTVASDWLGSNRTWFDFLPPPAEPDVDVRENMESYWTTHARPQALRAAAEAGLMPARICLRTGFAHLFGTERRPTPLQQYAENVSIPDGPVLFIIEDMTGAGKTEAAVIMAHRLMLAGKASGLHIGLPTMATANAMFERMAGTYRRLFDDGSSPSIVLTHGRRDLFAGFARVMGNAFEGLSDSGPDGTSGDQDDPSEIEATGFCADWIARSNKQAFLAQVGAGTIDQGILSVLPARHQSLRLWGLSDQVLVVDEAHAYDAYMSREIERLLEFHAGLGGSAIVLSATLPQAKRADWVNSFVRGIRRDGNSRWVPARSAYPLVTSVAPDSVEEIPVALGEGLAREVSVQRLGSVDDAHARVLEAARQGAAVALIRNTVDEAIVSYQTLVTQFEDVVLFHARFAMGDRQTIETGVLKRFGKGKTGDRNAIVVATQVIEQSLDLDFDLMVTDLAPIDLLIQRAGRLWRHPRRERPIAGPTLLVVSPEPVDHADSLWPAPILPKANAVYRNAALLWRSATAIFRAGAIVSRASSACGAYETGDVRALVEAVYGEQIAIPPGLEVAENEAAGRGSAERTQAGYSTLEFAKGYDWDHLKWQRDTRVKTRLGEEMITLRLSRVERGRVVPWMPVEDGDIRRAWMRSEVTIRRSLCAGSDNCARLQSLIDREKRHWTLSEQEIYVIALEERGIGRYVGQVRNGKNIPKSVFYSSTGGLEVSI